MITLSPDQNVASKKILEWARSQESLLTFGGVAGSGKSFLISHLSNVLRNYEIVGSIAFCALTGRATQVLKSKLVEARAIWPEDSVSTIHSLIYKPIVDDTTGELLGWDRRRSLECDLIIADESSMIDRELFEDLKSYGIPILAVGDHAQLPPVNSNFNLMENPDIRLENIHRQAEGSPIIKMSFIVRTGGRLEYKNYGDGVRYISNRVPVSLDIISEFFRNYDNDSIVICGTNKERVRYNLDIRAYLGFQGESVVKGEKVICLRNNTYARCVPIYNGMTGTVREITLRPPHWYKLIVDLDNEENYYTGNSSKYFFDNVKGEKPDHIDWMSLGDMWDRGYAITCHKSQGGQWDKVLLFERKRWSWTGESEEDYRRWLYTGITRAVKELTIIG